MTGRRIVLVDIGEGLTLTGILPTVALHGAYSAKLVARGGVAPYTFTTPSTLPVGLTLDRATGVFSATDVATAGTFVIVVTVTDVSGATATKTFTLQVISQPVIAMGHAPGGTVGTAYSYTYAATGGVPPYTWSISSGQVPPGLSLNPSTGELSGTPSTEGSASWMVRVADSHAAMFDLSDQTTIAKPSYHDVVMMDAPVRYYRLADLVQTPIKDETNTFSGNASSLVILDQPTINGDPSHSMKMPSKEYMRFDPALGTADTVDYSIEIWAALNNTTVCRLPSQVLQADPTRATNLQLTVNAGKISQLKYPSSGAAAIVTGVVIPALGTYHIVYTESIAARKIYVNGVLVASDTGHQTYTGIAPDYTLVGADQAITSTEITVKDVAVYNHVLTADRIAAHYNIGK